MGNVDDQHLKAYCDPLVAARMFTISRLEVEVPTEHVPMCSHCELSDAICSLLPIWGLCGGDTQANEVDLEICTCCVF